MSETIYTTDGEGRAVKQTVEVTEEVILTNVDKVSTSLAAVLTSLGMFSDDKISDIVTQQVEALNISNLIAE